VVAEIGRRCPGLTIVTTSQRPLRITGERLLRLAPLSVPAAVALFAARSAAAHEGFVVDDTNRDAITAVCRWVEGLPLAVELAAARMAMVTPAELLDRLDHPLSVLAGGGRDRPARHRSLRATIASSLDVVSPAAGDLFDLLGAFAGGVALDDLERVAARLGHDRGGLFEALAELVEMSLIRVQVPGPGSRYVVPDPVRHVAAERLAAGVREAAVRLAVARHYLDQVRQGPGADADNVRAALGWAVHHAGAIFEPEDQQELLHYYDRTGRLAEGQSLFSRLAVTGPAIAAVHAGHLARLRGDFDEARRLGAVALDRLPTEDYAGRSRAHLMLGSVATENRDAAGSRRELHAALAHARRARDVGLLGRALNNLGTRSMELGRLRDAERLLTAALEAKTRAGADEVDRGRTLFNLAETALDAGKLDLARERADQARRSLVAGGHPRLAAFAGSAAALARLQLGDVAGAVVTRDQVLELLGESDDDRVATVIALRLSVVRHAAGDRAGAAGELRRVMPALVGGTERDREELANALDRHAGLLAATAPASTAGLLGASDRLRGDSGRPRSLVVAGVAGRAAERARRGLGATAFERAYGRGRRDPLSLLTADVLFPAEAGVLG
jgi:tetratricopeptide (TPR) repeat protein